MDLLQNLLGGGQQRQEYQDFVNRYDQGSPYDGISDQEAYSRYQQIAPQIPQDVYQESAQEAFSRMSPQERRQFGQQLRQQAQQHNLNFPDLNGNGVDDRMEQDPRYLAQITGQMHQQQPGLLGQLLGGGGGGMQQMLGGGQTSGAANMLGNPLAKAAMAGIAAMAVKRMMSGGLGGQQAGGSPFGRSGGGGFGGTDM